MGWRTQSLKKKVINYSLYDSRVHKPGSNPNWVCSWVFTCCLSCVSCSFISSHLCLDSVTSFSNWSVTAQLVFPALKRKHTFSTTTILFLLNYWPQIKADHGDKKNRGCTHKVSLFLLLLLHLFHHLCDPLQLRVHQLLLQLLVLEHLVYMLPEIHQISFRLMTCSDFYCDQNW